MNALFYETKRHASRYKPSGRQLRASGVIKEGHRWEFWPIHLIEELISQPGAESSTARPLGVIKEGAADDGGLKGGIGESVHVKAMRGADGKSRSLTIVRQMRATGFGMTSKKMPGFPANTGGTPTDRGKARRYTDKGGKSEIRRSPIRGGH